MPHTTTRATAPLPRPPSVGLPCLQDISPQMRLVQGTYRGATVGLPLDGSALVALYRQDVMRELGLQVG